MTTGCLCSGLSYVCKNNEMYVTLEKLQSEGREFYIVVPVTGDTFMNGLDNAPDIISTELFSSYAITCVQTDGTGVGAKCGLCHICPPFLGICYSNFALE